MAINMKHEFSTNPNNHRKPVAHKDTYRRVARRMELELNRNPHLFFVYKMLDAGRAEALLRSAPPEMSPGWPPYAGRSQMLVIASRALPGQPSMLNAVSNPTPATLEAVRAEGNVAGFMMQTAAGDPELMAAAAKWIVGHLPANRPSLRIEPIWSQETASLAIDAARSALGLRRSGLSAATPTATRH